MALNVFLLPLFYSQSCFRKVHQKFRATPFKLQRSVRKKNIIIIIIIRGGGRFFSLAKPLSLCTHFQGLEGKKKKKKNSGNCQNTCLLTRKPGGVWGREINLFLLLRFIPLLSAEA